jgi:hypothetical protein
LSATRVASVRPLKQGHCANVSCKQGWPQHISLAANASPSLRKFHQDQQMTQHFDSDLGRSATAPDRGGDWARQTAANEIAENALRILIEIFGDRAQGVLDEIEKAAKARFHPSTAILSEITFIVDRARLSIPLQRC